MKQSSEYYSQYLKDRSSLSCKEAFEKAVKEAMEDAIERCCQSTDRISIYDYDGERCNWELRQRISELKSEIK